MRIRTKVWITMLSSFLLSLLVMILLTGIAGAVWLKGYNLQNISRISQETLSTIQKQGANNERQVRAILTTVHRQNPSLRLEWVASDGTVLYDSSEKTRQLDFQKLANSFVDMPNNLWAVGRTVTIEESLFMHGRSYYLLLSIPSNAMKAGQIEFYARSYWTVLTIIFPFLLSALVPYFLCLWLFSSINRRISKLNHALSQVSVQNDMLVLEDTSKDEIGQLSLRYNLMAERLRSQAIQIEQFEDRRKLLLSSLSHDLRTPLTMILGYAETMRTGLYRDDSDLQTSAKIILQRSRYMDKLLDQLLDVSQQEPNTFDLHRDLHNVPELMRRIVADYLLFLDGQDFEVQAEIPENEFEAFIDAPLIDRAIRNLLDNAIRYGCEGQFLGIELHEEENDVCISVTDRGKGISVTDQKYIFERSFRADNKRKDKGLGIGLSLVKKIIESHQGTVQFTSIPYQKTMFSVRLPKRRLN